MLETLATNRGLILRLSLLAGALLLLAVTLPADLAAVADIARRPQPQTGATVIKKSIPAPKAIMEPATLGKPTPQTAAAAPQVKSPTTSPARSWITPAVDTEPVQTAATSTTTPPEPAELVASSIGSPVNLRIGPSKSSPALKVLPAGTPVRIAESVRGWVHVYADDGSSGWVYSTFLSGGVQPSQPRIAKFDFDQPAPAAAKPKGRIKLQSQMTVRDGPGGAPIYTVGPGDQVRIAEVRGKWARIVTATGESGWVRLR